MEMSKLQKYKINKTGQLLQQIQIDFAEVAAIDSLVGLGIQGHQCCSQYGGGREFSM